VPSDMTPDENHEPNDEMIAAYRKPAVLGIVLSLTSFPVMLAGALLLGRFERTMDELGLRLPQISESLLSLGSLFLLVLALGLGLGPIGARLVTGRFTVGLALFSLTAGIIALVVAAWVVLGMGLPMLEAYQGTCLHG
jgi:hypothetical protein